MQVSYRPFSKVDKQETFLNQIWTYQELPYQEQQADFPEPVLALCATVHMNSQSTMLLMNCLKPKDITFMGNHIIFSINIYRIFYNDIKM